MVEYVPIRFTININVSVQMALQGQIVKMVSVSKLQSIFAANDYKIFLKDHTVSGRGTQAL